MHYYHYYYYYYYADDEDFLAQASVEIQKEVFGFWLPLPCIDGFGSCSYDDFCQNLAMISSCPSDFTQHGVPCHCPFPAVSLGL